MRKSMGVYRKGSRCWRRRCGRANKNEVFMWRRIKMWGVVHVLWCGRLPLMVNRKGRRLLSLPALLLACLMPQGSNAQILDIISIINTAVKKVIVATDLEVERMQT